MDLFFERDKLLCMIHTVYVMQQGQQKDWLSPFSYPFPLQYSANAFAVAFCCVSVIFIFPSFFLQEDVFFFPTMVLHNIPIVTAYGLNIRFRIIPGALFHASSLPVKENREEVFPVSFDVYLH